MLAPTCVKSVAIRRGDGVINSAIDIQGNYFTRWSRCWNIQNAARHGMSISRDVEASSSDSMLPSIT